MANTYSTYTTKPFIGIAFLNPLSAQPCEVDTVVMPILQMSTLRPREVKGCDQGHTASKWWSRDLNSGSLAALPPSCVKTHVLHVLSPPACHDTQPVQSVIPLLERWGDPGNGLHVFKNNAIGTSQASNNPCLSTPALHHIHCS